MYSKRGKFNGKKIKQIAYCWIYFYYYVFLCFLLIYIAKNHLHNFFELERINFVYKCSVALIISLCGTSIVISIMLFNKISKKKKLTLASWIFLILSMIIFILLLGRILYANRDIVYEPISYIDFDAFNAKFSSYEGTNVPGTRVNELILTVIDSNQNRKKDHNHYPSVELEAIGLSINGGDILITANDKDNLEDLRVKTGYYYTVTCHYNNTDLYLKSYIDKLQ